MIPRRLSPASLPCARGAFFPHRAPALFALALLSIATPARGITQPGSGVTIPVLGGGCLVNDPSDVGVCLNQNEASLGGTQRLDAQSAARIDRQTFNPLCSLTFEIVHRGAEFRNTFGWYEVTRDATGASQRPALTDLHVFLDCEDAPGTTRQLTLPAGVREIGFFMANSGSTCVTTGGRIQSQPENLFFSEPALNGDGRRHQLLTWQSLADSQGFYFGWEDDGASGDDDFDDLLTFVSGIQCAGSGAFCKTDRPGICADGTEQCRGGDRVCVPIQTPGGEKCNALDDDCNGQVDDGELCRVDEVCFRGKCVPRCNTGEFACGVGLDCNEGVCIDPECAQVTCETGKVCRQGRCVGACDGVRCPYGQACRAGVCVGACEGVMCDDGYACEVAYPAAGGEPVGRCSSCDCRGCDGGLVCTAHLCRDASCAAVTCSPGQHCVAGACVDDCQGASCPVGELCNIGKCQPDPTASGRGGSAGNPTVIIGTGGTPPRGSGGAAGQQSSTGGAPPAGAGRDSGAPGSGCACRAASEHGSSRGLLALASLMLLVSLGFARRKPSLRG